MTVSEAYGMTQLPLLTGTYTVTSFLGLVRIPT